MQSIKFPNNQDAKAILSEPAEGIYLITFCNGDDNRLVTDFCQAVLSAFDKVEELAPVGSVGAVVTTGSIPKFYSNGLDLDHAGNTEGFWEKSFYPLLHRVASFHLPCVAAINGHAFAGGAMLALCHDYRITNGSKGFLCLNEVHFGAPLMTGMMACVKARVGPAALRKCVLEGHRFAGAEQVELGFADKAVDPADNGVVKAAIKEAQRLTPFSKSGVYGKLKLEMNAALLATLNIQVHDKCVATMSEYDDKQDAFQESRAKL